MEAQQTEKNKIDKEKNETSITLTLDELRDETKNLLSLLTNRQPGLRTWKETLHEQLKKMNKLISQALDM